MLDKKVRTFYGKSEVQVMCPAKNFVFAVFIIFTVVAGLCLYIILYQKDPIYPIEKTIRYSFLVTNKTSEHIEEAAFRVFAPVKKNSYQLVEKITANKPFEKLVDKSGNQSLIFRLKNFPPHGEEVISITVQVKFALVPQPFSIEDEFFLLEEPYIEVQDPEVSDLAKKLGGNVEQISDWIHKNITDIGYIAEDRGARYAITKKRGDCTEFASAFVALARASGIPSRMIGGFKLGYSGKLQAESYHNWAEYKQDNSWSIVDAQNHIVDSGYGEYIAFYNFDAGSRLENSHRFLAFDSRLRVQMM